MTPLFSFACMVCFGNPASPLSKGAIAGVIFMVALVSLVLAGIAATAIVWARRSKELEHHAS